MKQIRSTEDGAPDLRSEGDDSSSETGLDGSVSEWKILIMIQKA